ncbi:MAG: twin transmembrane helix small protein [Gammaproteobacteria bacterium]|jgi:FlaG/FlaF family flagellin (archaellin)|nr:twin transmembrane helix small protein [Gammaproteobacteria bacterium]MDH4310235.1 twin transmembrane helix small protein [Gammaproteobacteria bacterium]MDH5273975.1 twin transmembrane helix small protein [Gammaproteobacteria bacterium]
MLIKILIVVVLAAIILSLFSGLFHLVKETGESKRMVNALTVRIALSVALFILLFIAWYAGLITPHHVR